MGKKSTGCLVIFLLLILGIGIFAYVFLLKPAMENFATLTTIHELNEEIENREDYVPPSDGKLESSQVERFVSVQKEISSRLQPKIAELQEQYAEKRQAFEEGQVSMPDLLTAWEELLQIYADAKRIQVEALNKEDFSLEEYRYVQQTFYQTLEHDLLPLNLDAIAAAAENRDPSIDLDEFKVDSKSLSEEALKHNRDLVSEYTGEVEEWLMFAWWGL